MTIKVCYQNQIHRFSKLPVSFKALTDSVTRLFEAQLPNEWALQYVDSDGDSVMLSSENDFKNLVEEELGSSKRSVKVHVISLNDLSLSQIQPKVNESTQSEGYDVIEKQESAVNTQNQKNISVEEPKLVLLSESVTISQNHEEKKIEAEPIVHSLNKQEDEPQDTIQATKEDKHTRKNKKANHSVQKILKKLSRSDLPEPKKQKLQAKLRDYEGSLTSEEREQFYQNKEEILKRSTKNETNKKAVLKETMTQVLYEQLPVIASLTKELLKEDNISQEKKEEIHSKPKTSVIHHRVACDGCKQSPIIGIRYKCYVCPDFDYCEACEANVEHPHPFIKIKESQEPLRQQCRAPLNRFGDVGSQQGPSEENKGDLGSIHQPEETKTNPRTQNVRNEQPQGSLFGLDGLFGGLKGLGSLGGFGGLGGLGLLSGLGNLFGGESSGVMEPLFKSWNQFKATDTFKNLMSAFFSGQDNQGLNKEKTIEDVLDFYTSLPGKCQEFAAQQYRNLPQELREKINKLLFGLPEDILGGNSQAGDEKEAEESKVRGKRTSSSANR